MKASKLFWAFQLVVVTWGSAVHAMDETSTNDFERVYQAWDRLITEKRSILDSLSTRHPVESFFTNDHYHAMAAMGAQALPLLIGKMEQGSKDPDSNSKWLGYLVSRTTKASTESVYRIDPVTGAPDLKFPEYPEWDGKESLRILWWRTGRFRVGKRFAELYPQWRKLRNKKDSAEAEKVYKRIKNLGIPALPYLMQKLDESPELVAVVAYLTSDSVAPTRDPPAALALPVPLPPGVPPTASPAECREWWKANKKRYELPGQPFPD